MQKYRQRKSVNAAPVAARLKKIRHHFGYNQDEMAKALDLDKGAYSKNERGYHLPHTTTLFIIREKLGVSVDWLLFGYGPAFWKAEESKKEIKGKKREAVAPTSTAEIEEMTDLLKRIPFLRHAVIGYYQKFKLENSHLIEKIRE